MTTKHFRIIAHNIKFNNYTEQERELLIQFMLNIGRSLTPLFNPERFEKAARHE